MLPCVARVCWRWWAQGKKGSWGLTGGHFHASANELVTWLDRAENNWKVSRKRPISRCPRCQRRRSECLLTPIHCVSIKNTKPVEREKKRREESARWMFEGQIWKNRDEKSLRRPRSWGLNPDTITICDRMWLVNFKRNLPFWFVPRSIGSCEQSREREMAGREWIEMEVRATNEMTGTNKLTNEVQTRQTTFTRQTRQRCTLSKDGTRIHKNETPEIEIGFDCFRNSWVPWSKWRIPSD